MQGRGSSPLAYPKKLLYVEQVTDLRKQIHIESSHSSLNQTSQNNFVHITIVEDT